jgi:hypothetical protein
MRILPQSYWAQRDGNNLSLNKDYKLDNLIDYPELFEAIPEMRGVRVELGDGRGGSAGYYDHKN